MNIPHLKPVKFAQNILSVDEKIAVVENKFPHKPTLPMLFEAAAQSSAAFSEDSSKIGFLVSVKDTELLNENVEEELLLEVQKSVEFGTVCEFLFKAMSRDKSIIFATGILTVMIQE